MKTIKFKIIQEIELTLPKKWKKSEAKQLAQDIAQGIKTLNGTWDTKTSFSYSSTIKEIEEIKEPKYTCNIDEVISQYAQKNETKQHIFKYKPNNKLYKILYNPRNNNLVAETYNWIGDSIFIKSDKIKKQFEIVSTI